MGPFPITSERLQLREFRLEDERAIHEYASDPEVTMHTGWGPNDEETTRTVLRQWIVDQQAWPRNSVPLGIELRSEKKLIGSTGFASIDGATGFFGFVLHKRFWGHGFATEACRALTWLRLRRPQPSSCHGGVFCRTDDLRTDYGKAGDAAGGTLPQECLEGWRVARHVFICTAR